MGWLDVINIGMNAAQFYQVKKARDQLNQMQAGTATTALVKQVTEVLRNFVFESTKDMKLLEEKLPTMPQPVYVAARALQVRFQQFGISPALFPEFADKEYVQRVQEDLTTLVQKSQSQLTQSQCQQAEECLTAIQQMPLLDQAIEGQFAREQIQASEDEWKVLSAQKGKFTSIGLLAIVGWFIVPPGVLFVGYMITTLLPSAFRGLEGLLCLLSLGAAAVPGIGMPIAAIYFSKPIPGYNELQKTRKEWATKIPSKDVWEQIASTFGQQSSEDYQNLRANRLNVVQAVLGQADAFDKLLPASSTGVVPNSAGTSR